MIEKCLGVITGVKIATINSEADDGTKVKLPVCEFKVESCDIECGIIEVHFPLIHKHLCLGDTGNVLLTAEFDYKKYNLNFEFKRQSANEEDEKDNPVYKYEKVQLIKVKVVYKEDIPTYCFVFQKNIEKSDFYLNNAAKVNIKFSVYHNE